MGRHSVEGLGYIAVETTRSVDPNLVSMKFMLSGRLFFIITSEFILDEWLLCNPEYPIISS